tara:strand:- start:256 stop:573 length:318 start_codon:yes stop_codon:yes gene_type:complete
MQLALAIGAPPSEVDDWGVIDRYEMQAYLNVKRLPLERLELQLAQLLAMVSQISGGRAKVEDFILDPQIESDADKLEREIKFGEEMSRYLKSHNDFIKGKKDVTR